MILLNIFFKSIAIPWGLISDYYGRKPVIMIGQLSSIIGLFLFGLSKSYTFAIIVKTISGLMVGLCYKI